MSIDFRRTHRALFRATAEPSFVDVPRLPFLMVDGVGDPATSLAYRSAVEALYRTAYRVRAAHKATGLVYTVPPLQGLWQDVGDGTGDRSSWRWTMMIMQPSTVDPGLVDGGEVRLEWFTEGLSAQILHIGRYQEETPTIHRLLDHIGSQGRTVTGRHHEIYLSDNRRTAPDRLRTIIRYGVH